MRIVLRMIAGIATLALSALSAGAEVNSFAIRHVDVFDGKAMKRAQDVIVRDGLIDALGPRLAIPAGLTVVDGSGRTLLPGLIDSHVHSWGRSREDALRFGVTTELDMFMDWHAIADARTQRQSLSQTALSDLWSAGTLATVAGGHGTEYGLHIPTLSAASEAGSWVDARIGEGSDYIKIILEAGSAQHRIPTLSPEEVAALAAAAHQKGRMAVAHVQTLETARVAVTSGVDGLAHIFIDQRADDAFIQMIRRRHLFVIPTLTVFSSYSCGPIAPSLARDPGVAPYLTQEQVAQLGSNFGVCLASALDTGIQNTMLLAKAGVPLLAGTDAGNPGTTHGASLAGEIELLSKSGLTPAQALSAATSVPASLFGLKDRGIIARGRRADLVLVEGDPVSDPTALRHIAAVWKNGYTVKRNRPPASAQDAAGALYPAQFLPVKGPLGDRSPAAVYAGHITVAGSSGVLDVTLEDGEVFRGEWHPVAFGGEKGADARNPADLAQEWDLVYGEGHHKSKVLGNQLHSRALLTGASGATLVAEIVGDESYHFSGVARDSRGNVYKISFGP